ncbi:MAG: hypothetical protein P1U57_09980 [Oleibacter sp.]|nr:hypothetical protein [Thalassolituus sp.]
MSNNEDPKKLLAELERLQRVLDSNSHRVPDEDNIPVLEDLFDHSIPVLNDSIHNNQASVGFRQDIASAAGLYSTKSTGSKSTSTASSNTASMIDIPVLRDIADIQPAPVYKPKPVFQSQPANQFKSEAQAKTASQIKPAPELKPAPQLKHETQTKPFVTAEAAPKQEIKPAPKQEVKPEPKPTISSKHAEIGAAMSETNSSLSALNKRERLIDELVEEMMPMIKSSLRARIRKMLDED